MSTVIATVSVNTANAAGGTQVQFYFPPTGETVFVPLPDRRALEAVRRRAGVYLERLVHLLPWKLPDGERAEEAMRFLVNTGRELVGQLVQHDTDRFLQLQASFRKAWPYWAVDGWDEPSVDLPIVELRCHDDPIPLELLPVFDFGGTPPLYTYHDRRRVAARFLGFSAVVRRIVPSPVPGDHVLRNEPVLPVQFLRHRRLAAATREEEFLASLTEHVRVDGPWPTDQDADAVREAVVRALCDGAALNPDESHPPVQVQHFACHCDTSTELDDDYTLTLSTRRGRERQITFGQLREAYYERFFAGQDHAGPRSVIILNACASSRTNPLTAFSFPRWFLNQGHRAFIGTETDVPDEIAAQFATSFYGRLLEHRRPLGEAVVWARRDLLRDFRNPLGLLYVMYGDSDLTVERARPGIYRGSPATD